MNELFGISEREITFFLGLTVCAIIGSVLAMKYITGYVNLKHSILCGLFTGILFTAVLFIFVNHYVEHWYGAIMGLDAGVLVQALLVYPKIHKAKKHPDRYFKEVDE